MLLRLNPACAQTDTISLPQALERAEKNNGNIKIAELGIRQSESRVRELRSLRLPSIFFRSHYLLAPEIGYNEIVTNGGEYGAQIAAGMPLYDGGVKSALIGQAEDNSERSSVARLKSKSEIAFGVRMTYYEVLRARREFDIRTETANRLKEYFSFLTRLRAGGSASESDVLKAQVDVNEAIAAIDAAKQSLQKAKLLLNNIIGGSPATDIEVQSLGSSDTTHTPTFQYEKNLDIQLLMHDKKSSTYDVTIAQGERLPTLTIAGDVGALGVKPNEFRHDIGYSISLSLEIPILTWGGIDYRIEQKELAVQQLETQIELERRELETEWQITVTDFETARKTLATYADNISTAENNYLSAKSRFAGGSGSNLDVLDAQRTLVGAKLNYENTLFQLRSDAATLLKLSGQQ